MPRRLSRHFSREDLIVLLQVLRDRVGGTPKEYDTYEYPDIPGHMVYVRRFGTWREALIAAGIPLDPRNMGYDRETVLAELRDIVEQLGRTPTQEEVRRMGGPCHNTFTRHCGGWSAALAELGLTPRSSRRYGTEELKEMLRDLANELGHVPTVAEMRARAEMPAPRTFRYRFGTWNEALRAAGLTPRHLRPRGHSEDP